jgi:hypothetical protein
MQRQSSAPHITQSERISDCFVPVGLFQGQLLTQNLIKQSGHDFQIQLDTKLSQKFCDNQASFAGQLTSYGSFFLTANEGMVPSSWVSAQWKMV